MTEQLQIVPLALIMVMGPQILTAIFLVTSREPARNSLAMLAGVFLAASLGLVIWFTVVDALGIDPDANSESGPSTTDWVVSGLLALLAIKTILGRGDAEAPKWMTSLQEATPRRAFTLAFLLILLMPTDIAATISTAAFLLQSNLEVIDGWPLVAGTLVLMALPITAYTLFGERAKRAMPGIRNWTINNSWLINLIVLVYFIYSLLA